MTKSLRGCEDSLRISCGGWSVFGVSGHFFGLDETAVRQGVVEAFSADHDSLVHRHGCKLFLGQRGKPRHLGPESTGGLGGVAVIGADRIDPTLAAKGDPLLMIGTGTEGTRQLLEGGTGTGAGTVGAVAAGALSEKRDAFFC